MKKLNKYDLLFLILIILTPAFIIAATLIGNGSKCTREQFQKVRVVTVEGDTVTIEAKRDGREVGIYKEK